MRKQIVIALAFTISAFSFAQKKEFKTAEKAIKNKNYAEASAALKQIESMLGSLDEDDKEKYYYLNAVTLFADGKGNFDDMTAAERNLKKVGSSYKKEVNDLKYAMIGDYLKKANSNYENKKYGPASVFFEKTYNLSKKDTVYLYYAAATAVSEPDYDRALDLYEKLKVLGYTGIEEQYLAVNKENGEEEVFPNVNMRDLSVKSGSHIKPTTKKSDSKKAEIVKNVALIYVSNNDNEKAIEAMKEARAESPDDVNLILTEANVHFKMGHTEEFKSLLVKATEMDPDNPELQYNLGVISAESKDIEAAKKYYKKALELDPNYINAYINMAALVLGGEQALIEEMNGLGSSKADDKRYEELKLERQQIYRDAIPYLTKALDINNKNQSAATTLMNIYSVLGETDKYKEMKAKVESLGGTE